MKLIGQISSNLAETLPI